MPLEPVTAIASAIAEASKVIGTWMASADRRKMQAAIESAEKYIMVSAGLGEFSNLTTTKRQALCDYWRKRFFKYN